MRPEIPPLRWRGCDSRAGAAGPGRERAQQRPVGKIHKRQDRAEDVPSRPAGRADQRFVLPLHPRANAKPPAMSGRSCSFVQKISGFAFMTLFYLLSKALDRLLPYNEEEEKEEE